MSYTDKINEVIDGSDVALFMKGTPAFAMCGNSDRALQGAAACRCVRHRGRRACPTRRSARSSRRSRAGRRSRRCSSRASSSAEPTSSRSSRQSGELEETLRAKLGDDYAAARDEQTVALV